jgi:hypothetical protein
MADRFTIHGGYTTRILVTTVVAFLAFACGGAIGEPTVGALRQEASAQSSVPAKDEVCGEPFKGPSWGTTRMDITEMQTTGFLHAAFTGSANLSGLGLSQIVLTHGLFLPDKSAAGSMTSVAASGDVSGGPILDQDGTFTGGTGRFANAEGAFKALGKLGGPPSDPGSTIGRGTSE